MGHADKPKAPASPLATLSVAWVVVVGLSFAPVGLYYYQSHNLVFLMSFSGAAFIIGASLFIALGLARIGTNAKHVDNSHIGNLNRRGAIFGKR